MTVYVDTSVVMYAAGRHHPRRRGCQAVLAAVADGALDAVTSAEVVQEILHRFCTGDRAIGAAMAVDTLELFRPVLAIDDEVMRLSIQIWRRTPRLSARDAIHVAACRVHGLVDIVSVDEDFDTLAGVRRLDPDAWVR